MITDKFKKISKGDILLVTHWWDVGNSTFTGQIIDDNGVLKFRGIKSKSFGKEKDISDFVVLLSEINLLESEIIGNIDENPELLEIK